MLMWQIYKEQETERLEHGVANLKAWTKKLPIIHNENTSGDILDRGYLVEMCPCEIQPM